MTSGYDPRDEDTAGASQAFLAHLDRTRADRAQLEAASTSGDRAAEADAMAQLAADRERAAAAVAQLQILEQEEFEREEEEARAEEAAGIVDPVPSAGAAEERKGYVSMVPEIAAVTIAADIL